MEKRSIKRPATSLRTQLMRSASVLAMVIALNHTPASAQTLAVLHNAAAVANAATAAKFPNGLRSDDPSGKGSLNGSNSARMQGAQLRALQYQARVTQAVSM